MKNNAITISLAIALSLIMSISGFGQDTNTSPYAIFGDKTPVCDIQHHNVDNELINIIILYDTTYVTLRISNNWLQVIDEQGDTLIEQTGDFVGNAFFSTIDPKAIEFSNVNPYLYCLGNPILMVDKDGKRPNEYESAMMAEIVYYLAGNNSDDDNERMGLLVDELKCTGWEQSNYETSITMNRTAWYENGLQSALFERTVDGKTEYAYVYAGTNTVRDGTEDLRQIVGQSTQVLSAISNAKTLSKELGGHELTLIGHSLGAAEAAGGSMATGRPAITFNPAAISPATRILNGLGSPNNIVNYRAVPPGKGLFRVGGCVVNNIQDKLGMPAPGKTVKVEINVRNPFEAHSIKHMVDYFREHRNENGRIDNHRPGVDAQ